MEILKRIDENPEAVDEFTREEATEARDAFRELVSAEDADFTAEELDTIAAHLDRLNTRLEAIEAADAEKAAKLEAVRSQFQTDEPEAEEPAEEPAEEIDFEVAEEPAEVEEKEPVTASAKPALKSLKDKLPAERKPREEPPALVPSAGEAQGQRFTDRRAFGAYMQKAWKGAGNGQFTVFSYGTDQEPIRHRFNLDDSPSRTASVLAEVQQAAQEEGNLVASGGFCAPAEVLYDFFNVATRSGLVQLPTVGAPRGSIQYPVSPTLADFIGQNGIASVWDNSTDITPGENTKPVFTVDCPETAECEVAAYATILQFGNFGARFYPENVANSTALAMIAAARVVNAAAITALQGASTTVSVAGSTLLGGGIVNLSTVLAGQAAEYRQLYGMGLDAALDVIVPHWLDDALFADAIARDSTTEYQDVIRKVRGVFAELNLRVQYVYDYQALADGFFPTTVDVLLMAPGTAVRLDGGTLDLGVVRDSTLNATNDYQTFVEEFTGWCFPGHEVREIEDIPICPNGGTGDRASLVCATSS